jgi:hypothetical protein
MTPRPITRGDLHARLPIAGHEALVAYAEREGISLNTALWLLVRRGLESEGVRVEVGGRRSGAAGVERTPVVDVEAVAGAAAELVERAVADAAGPASTSSTSPRRPGPRRRRRR